LDVIVKDGKTYLYKGDNLTNFLLFLKQKSPNMKKKGKIENCELFNMPIFTIIKEVDHEEGGFL